MQAISKLLWTMILAFILSFLAWFVATWSLIKAKTKQTETEIKKTKFEIELEKLKSKKENESD